MNITGLHHVTAITANAAQNLQFYTQVLGLRLVKKTVNQDDVSAYHLFYADKVGSPGTDITFFDWPESGPRQSGIDSIATTLFRVKDENTLHYWVERLDALKVDHRSIQPYGPYTLVRFNDPEGQDLAIVSDNNAPFHGQVWEKSTVPAEYALRGFYAVRLAVPSRQQIEPILTDVLGWPKVNEFADSFIPGSQVAVYAIDGGGPGKEVHVIEQSGERGWNSSGTVHHVAFRVYSHHDLEQWLQRLNQAGIPNSGLINRFYFESLYFRISPGILFEIATDGPGFATDESYDKLGQSLSLPPFLEPRRAEIESHLQPLP